MPHDRSRQTTLRRSRPSAASGRARGRLGIDRNARLRLQLGQEGGELLGRVHQMILGLARAGPESCSRATSTATDLPAFRLTCRATARRGNAACLGLKLAELFCQAAKAELLKEFQSPDRIGAVPPRRLPVQRDGHMVVEPDQLSAEHRLFLTADEILAPGHGRQFIDMTINALQVAEFFQNCRA